MVAKLSPPAAADAAMKLSLLKTSLHLAAWFAILFASDATRVVAQALDVDIVDLRARVLALGDLTAPPQVHAIDEASVETSGPRKIYFDGLSYRGKPTRVYAWYGVPSSPSGKVPAIVLAHGGGGTAYREWVEKWNARGFAAIAPALEGQTDEPVEGPARWKRHEWAGPARVGIYNDADKPLEDQWMYHAVADVVLAHNLLRSNPAVNGDRIGLMGISWGGIITSTVIGIDTRLAFAIPTYGCGYMATVDNQYRRSLADNLTYLKVWEPGLRFGQATMPVLWLTWLHDGHFPLDAQQASYRAAPGPRMVAVLPDMKHSHPAGWTPEDSYAFAESIVRDGKPWLREVKQQRDGDRVSVTFESSKPIDRAILFTTSDVGYTGTRNWTQSPAELKRDGDHITASATLPSGVRAYFFNVTSGALTASSEFVEIAAK